ncbi:MAG TPA: hypothetical protein PKD05_00850 [Candidatus Melainabacteria bacterium]|nr:hypothetical protein [Candidatus Melainabacteria bacterium]HMP50081.1 hypothetical protein [Candidatus Melainabacteria bacterium]
MSGQTQHPFTLHVNDSPRLSMARKGLRLVAENGQVDDPFYKGVLTLADLIISESKRIRSTPCHSGLDVKVEIPAIYSEDQKGEAFKMLERRGYAVMPTSIHGPTRSIWLTVPLD